MKIFCIGFNKTGTVSLDKFFNANGIKSFHAAGWWYWTNPEEFIHTAFTDGFEGNKYRKFPDLKWLENTFPESKFIVNTRNLDTWLLSRYNHATRVPNYFYKIKELNERLLLLWCRDRNFWHRQIDDYFKNKNNHLKVNVCEESSESLSLRLASFLQINLVEKIGHKNKFGDECSQNQLKVKRFLDNFVDEKDHSNDWIVKIYPYL